MNENEPNEPNEPKIARIQLAKSTKMNENEPK